MEAHAHMSGPEAQMSGKEPAWTVLGKYRMHNVVGEGSLSTCWRATCIETGEDVAVKVLNSCSGSPGGTRGELRAFRRQIEVLTELQEPFEPPPDPRLWNGELAQADPRGLFVRLLDYSRDSLGRPGPHPEDGSMYVVTELGQYSLKDYLKSLRAKNESLPNAMVREIARAVVLIMAGLHAKSFVHLDFKPDNLMMINGRAKLIDVDSCLKSGKAVSIEDSSICFSPCYCAPEWARFLTEDSSLNMPIVPALDVWSVGMTICELVTLDTALNARYSRFQRGNRSNTEAGILFVDWLSHMTRAPIPRAARGFDPELEDLLVDWLLVLRPAQRRTLAESLEHPFLSGAASGEPFQSDVSAAGQAPQGGAAPGGQKQPALLRARCTTEEGRHGSHEVILHAVGRSKRGEPGPGFKYLQLDGIGDPKTYNTAGCAETAT